MSVHLNPPSHPLQPSPLDSGQLLKKAKLMSWDHGSTKMQPFNLAVITPSDDKMRNRRFAHLMEVLVEYNKKLEAGRQEDIVNYRLHEFYYSTLQICVNKTESEVDQYLKYLLNWIDAYKYKREIIIKVSGKSQGKRIDDEAVRQTFKSNLPLEIDSYTRKVCLLDRKEAKAEGARGRVGEDSPAESEEKDYARRLFESPGEEGKHGKGDKENQKMLPNLRVYKTEMMKIRKLQQEKQEAKMLERMKKNQSRIHSQTANNFYSCFRNPNDSYNKDKQSDQPSLKEIGSNRPSMTSAYLYKKYAGQPGRNVVQETRTGFHDIKKKKMLDNVGSFKMDMSVTLPKFNFSKTVKVAQLDRQSSGDEDREVWEDGSELLVPIDGLELIKNPFQSSKAKPRRKK